MAISRSIGRNDPIPQADRRRLGLEESRRRHPGNLWPLPTRQQGDQVIANGRQQVGSVPLQLVDGKARGTVVRACSRSITASAWVRSIRPARKARLVNSPGSAGRTPGRARGAAPPVGPGRNRDCGVRPRPRGCRCGGVHEHGQRLIEGLAVGGDHGAVIELVAGKTVPRPAGHKDPAQGRRSLRAGNADYADPARTWGGGDGSNGISSPDVWPPCPPRRFLEEG